MSKKEQDKRRRARKRARVSAALKALYPDVFNPQDPKPLKIGIFDEIRAELPDIPKNDLKSFLAVWTRHPRYSAARDRALSGDSMRYDLSGNKWAPDYGIRARDNG